MQTLASRTGDEPASRWQPVCAAIPPLPTIDPPPSELRIALPDGGQARLPGALWPAARSSVPPRSGPPATSPIAVGEVARADVNALYEARGEDPRGAGSSQTGRPLAPLRARAQLTPDVGDRS